MKLSKPQESEFMFQMMLLMDSYTNRVLDKIPKGLIKKLSGDVHAQTSLIAGLLIIKGEEDVRKTR